MTRCIWLQVGDGVFEVLSTSGDTHLGGDDFDKKIVDYLADEFEKLEGIDLRKDRQVRCTTEYTSSLLFLASKHLMSLFHVNARSCLYESERPDGWVRGDSMGILE